MKRIFTTNFKSILKDIFLNNPIAKLGLIQIVLYNNAPGTELQGFVVELLVRRSISKEFPSKLSENLTQT